MKFPLGTILASIGSLALGGHLAGQATLPPQNPRQALIEMITGGEQGFKKHLTDAVRQRFEQAAQSSGQNSLALLKSITNPEPGNQNDFQSFTDGPLLFSWYNPEKHERLEVRIEGDDLSGDEDDMEVSLHAVKDGKEEEVPLTLRVLLTLRQQAGIWRLDALTFSARVPVGDTRLYDSFLWKTMVPSAFSQSNSKVPVPVADSKPKMPPLRAVRMIGLAENLYAQKHPAVGFTCQVSELVNVGHGIDNGELYTFLDPEFATGEYNGYRFNLSGCSGKPARVYLVTAEPLTGKGKAYCSDRSLQVRASDDGRVTTCMSSGKPALP